MPSSMLQVVEEFIVLMFNFVHHSCPFMLIDVMIVAVAPMSVM